MVILFSRFSSLVFRRQHAAGSRSSDERNGPRKKEPLKWRQPAPAPTFCTFSLASMASRAKPESISNRLTIPLFKLKFSNYRPKTSSHQSKLACQSWPHSLPPLSLSSRTLFLSHQFRAPLPSSPGIVSGGALINDVLTDDVLHWLRV